MRTGELPTATSDRAISDKEATAVVARFGFLARSVPRGFFIAPVSKNRFGDQHVGDDVMLVEHTGNIIPYAHDAQAFLAASYLSAALSKAGAQS